MRKFMLMAVMALFSVGAFAQYNGGEITVQPKIGLNVTNISDGDGDWKAGLAVGAELEYHATPMVGISAGLIYSMQGAKATEEGVDVKVNVDYINVPILANIYVAPGFALKTGLQPAFKVSSEVKAEGHAVDLDEIKSVDFSIPVGMSYEYQNICFDARYNIGLTKLLDGSDSKNQVFQITVGYKFHL